MRIFLNDIYPVKKYVLQISVGYKRKEDSSMEEMQTKEKQIVYNQALYKKANELAKKKHGTKKRIGGDPYITHPVAEANILKKEGYQALRTAASCREARKAFSSEAPDLIVLDCMLPDGDGFSLFQEFRADTDIAILFLSARDQDNDRLLGLGLGADDYPTCKRYGMDRGVPVDDQGRHTD